MRRAAGGELGQNQLLLGRSSVQTTERYLGRSQKAHIRVIVSSDLEKAGAGIDKNGHSEEDTRLSKDRLRRFEVYHSSTMLLSTLVKGSP